MEPIGVSVRVDVSVSGHGDLGFVRLSWHDNLSELFTGLLDVVSREPIADLKGLLGATVRVTLRGGARRVQHLSGEVDRVEHRGDRFGWFEYRLRLCPQVSRLSRRRRFRSFTEIDVDGVVKDLLAEHDVSAPLFRTTGTSERRELLIQHDETDLEFLTRLLGEEPIYWAFSHNSRGHRLVIADGPTDRGRKLKMIHTAADGEGLTEWIVAAERGERGVEVIANGRATAVGLDVGEVVHVARSDGVDSAYMIVSTDLVVETHDIEPPGSKMTPAEMAVDLIAVPAEAVPVGSSGLPTTGHVLTAIVVGPPGERVYVDDLGRVQVEFRLSDDDPQQPVWVRVAQPWAGDGHGTTYWPRIGDRVWVEFEEGDVSKPVVTASLYTDETPPPKPLPESQRSAIVASGAGEIVLDDRPGDEELRIHSKRDLSIDALDDGTVRVGDHLLIESENELVLRCGAASITLHYNGDIEIAGVDIIVNGQSSISLTSPSVSGT